MVRKIKRLNKSIIKSLILPIILIAIMIASGIIALFNLILVKFGYPAFIFSSLIWIFIIGYKKIINIKNWFLRGSILLLIGLIINSIFSYNIRNLNLSIMWLGVIFSIIIQYKIYMEARK